MVGEIAFRNLDKTTRDSVKKYLEGTTPEDAATWMDDVRSDPKYGYMAAWHYINIDKGQAYERNNDTNIISGITFAYNQLRQRSKLSREEVKTSLKILFHLLGDLQQPLHTGYKSDRGGNDVNVTFNKATMSLHQVWDEGIIESQNITLENCLDQYRSFSEQQINDIELINYVVWLNQSRTLLPQVYNFKNNTIDDQYVSLNKAVIEQQILCGGIRLCALLERAFRK